MSAPRAWDAALDDFEAHLARQRAAIAAGDVVAVRAFEPPAHLGPLPETLALRARALLGASRDLEVHVAAALVEIGDTLRAHETAPAAPRPEPAFFDSRV